MSETHETVKAFSNEVEATLARSRLAQEGIDGTVHRFSRYRALAGGGYVLKVTAADLSRALALLDELDTGIDMDEYVDADDTSYRRCPACRSVNVDTRPLGGWQRLLAVVSLGLFLWCIKRDCHCAKCGARWRA